MSYAYINVEKDPITRSEIESLLDEGQTSELEKRLGTRIGFGTAGLRARMQAGFARLNSLTIIQTSQGLAAHLLKTHPGAAEKGIVIGYDARHNSKTFAELAAAAFVAKGIKVLWYEDLVHTPMVPYGVKNLGAVAGVMITASHNPAQDNGYKVYGANGCQINSPEDAAIAASILGNLEPVTWDVRQLQSSPLVRAVLALMKGKYFQDVCGFVDQYLNAMNVPNFVYTPLHGVGLQYMTTALEQLRIGNSITAVQQQAQPDPDFPTVKYPNPEEAGALNLAKETADKQGVRLVLSNDPDADRFAVVEKVGDQWQQFTGDQVGVLLAYYLFSRMSTNGLQHFTMLNSAVSSQMLAEIAVKEGFRFSETLTGFKWLGNTALALEKAGNTVTFAYEEALGYMIPNIVHDKDGITAALLFLCAATQWGSPWEKLLQLYEKYGYFYTLNTYWRSPEVTITKKLFAMIQKLGNPFALTVGGRQVLRWRDLSNNYDSATRDNIPELPASRDSQMITCWLDGSKLDHGIRFTIRASGTEPKIKIYLECRSQTQAKARAGAGEILHYLRQEWFDDPNLTLEEKSLDR
ncbi:hypothetical protein LPUS_12130 [Lasallia pustulata]|uniref:Phosphoglucomutase n=1 Tax=Lasallia pustulata TaxID=136370 RepID=A0A1W5DDR8_9LECA|nr:hypothetical protein LPUS_12130 [Lasallia pustulata]